MNNGSFMTTIQGIIPLLLLVFHSAAFAVNEQISAPQSVNSTGCTFTNEECCLCIDTSHEKALKVTLTHGKDAADHTDQIRVVLHKTDYDGHNNSTEDEDGPRFDSITGPRYKVVTCPSTNSFTVNGGPKSGEYKVFLYYKNEYKEFNKKLYVYDQYNQKELYPELPQKSLPHAPPWASEIGNSSYAQPIGPAENIPFVKDIIGMNITGNKYLSWTDDCNNTFSIWIGDNTMYWILNSTCVKGGILGECIYSNAVNDWTSNLKYYPCDGTQKKAFGHFSLLNTNRDRSADNMFHHVFWDYDNCGNELLINFYRRPYRFLPEHKEEWGTSYIGPPLTMPPNTVVDGVISTASSP
jgi:hypothetical protein